MRGYGAQRGKEAEKDYAGIGKLAERWSKILVVRIVGDL